MFGANQLNPTADFLRGIGTNEDITSGLAEGVKKLFSGSNTPAYNQTQLRSEFVPDSFAKNYFTRPAGYQPTDRGYGYY
jgi:hypothetical protein